MRGSEAEEKASLSTAYRGKLLQNIKDKKGQYVLKDERDFAGLYKWNNQRPIHASPKSGNIG